MRMAKHETTISVPELIMVAGTRTALGAGVGLLLAERLNRDQRKGAGLALVFVGVVSTIPLCFEIFGGGRLHRSKLGKPGLEVGVDRAA